MPCSAGVEVSQPLVGQIFEEAISVLVETGASCVDGFVGLTSLAGEAHTQDNRRSVTRKIGIVDFKLLIVDLVLFAMGSPFPVGTKHLSLRWITSFVFSAKPVFFR